jgi:chloramphenicol 3-O phosphotransferase
MSEQGLVILLNGTSSAGKTSIARALQSAHTEPLVYLGWDAFAASIPPQFVGEDNPIITPEQADRLIAGYHRSVAAYAEPGNHVVLDALLLKPSWVADLRELLKGQRVCFVGVRCPLDEVERREATRGDRKAGTARAQFEAVHSNGRYDIEVNTAELSPEAAARRILDFLAHTPDPTAFRSAAATPVTP